MIDGFGRNIHYLRFSITPNCDLHCRYCKSKDRFQKDSLSADDIFKITRAASGLGIDKVRLTGGEPLLRADIIEIVSKIRTLDAIKEICITTNGQRLFDLAKDLKEAGVDRLNISLDTLDPSRYKKLTGGDLERVLKGIERARTYFNTIKLNVVYLKGITDKEVAGLITFCKDRGLILRFIELMPIGEALKYKDLSKDPESDLLGHDIIKTDRVDGVSTMYKTANGQDIGLIRAMSHGFCKDCDRIRITADGKLKTCLFADKEYDLLGKDEKAIMEIIKAGIGAKPLSKEAVVLTKRSMDQIGG